MGRNPQRTSSLDYPTKQIGRTLRNVSLGDINSKGKLSKMVILNPIGKRAWVGELVIRKSIYSNYKSEFPRNLTIQKG